MWAICKWQLPANITQAGADLESDLGHSNKKNSNGALMVVYALQVKASQSSQIVGKPIDFSDSDDDDLFAIGKATLQLPKKVAPPPLLWLALYHWLQPWLLSWCHLHIRDTPISCLFIDSLRMRQEFRFPRKCRSSSWRLLLEQTYNNDVKGSVRCCN